MRLSPWMAKLLLQDGPAAALRAHQDRANQVVKKRKPGVRLGAAVDRLLFGVGDELVTVPDHYGDESEQGKLYLTDKEFQLASKLALVTEKAWPEAARGDRQRHMTWQDREFGHTCSTKPDHVDPETHFDTDLKTIWDISDRETKRHIDQFGYDIAAAAGLDMMDACYGWDKRWYRWCFVSTTEPYEVRFVDLDIGTYERGYKKWREANRIWAECLKSGVWPEGEKKPKPLTYKQANDPIKYIEGE